MKRLLAAILALFMFGAAFAAPARAEDIAITIHDGATVKITYRLVNTTPTDHHAQVEVWNKTPEPITGWSVELGLRARVLKTSGASLVRQEAGVAEFLADRAKNTIPPRRNISFWYWAEGGEGATIPVPTATGLKGEGRGRAGLGSNRHGWRHAARRHGAST